MYIDIILESENMSDNDSLFLEQIVEEATFDACMDGGEEAVGIFEQYVELLESGEEIDEKAEEELSESFSAYVENVAGYYAHLCEAFDDTAEDVMRRRQKEGGGTVAAPKPGMMAKMRGKMSGMGGAMKAGMKRAKAGLAKGVVKMGAKAIRAGQARKSFATMVANNPKVRGKGGKMERLEKRGGRLEQFGKKLTKAGGRMHKGTRS